MPTLTNKCSCCHKSKPLSAFYVNRGKPAPRCKMCDSAIKKHDRDPAQQLARVRQLHAELKELDPAIGEELEIVAEPYESLATLEQTIWQAMYMNGLRATYERQYGRRIIKVRIIRKCL